MQVEDHGSRSRLGRDQPFGRYVTGHDGLDVDISRRFEEPFFPLHHGAVSFERSVPIEEGPPHVEEEPKAPASETGHRDVLGRSPREADVARGRRRVALAPDNDRSTDRPVKGSTAAYPRFSPRVVAVEATRRSGMEAHLAPLSAGVEEECPLRFARSLARPSTHSLPKKASESSLQAMVRLGTSSRSRYTGLGTEGTRGAPPRSHRPIQVRRTQAS